MNTQYILNARLILGIFIGVALVKKNRNLVTVTYLVKKEIRKVLCNLNSKKYLKIQFKLMIFWKKICCKNNKIKIRKDKKLTKNKQKKETHRRFILFLITRSNMIYLIHENHNKQIQ